MLGCEFGGISKGGPLGVSGGLGLGKLNGGNLGKPRVPGRGKLNGGPGGNLGKLGMLGC